MSGIRRRVTQDDWFACVDHYGQVHFAIAVIVRMRTATANDRFDQLRACMLADLKKTPLVVSGERRAAVAVRAVSGRPAFARYFH